MPMECGQRAIARWFRLGASVSGCGWLPRTLRRAPSLPLTLWTVEAPAQMSWPVISLLSFLRKPTIRQHD
jgi:hypothetical protein